MKAAYRAPVDVQRLTGWLGWSYNMIASIRPALVPHATGSALLQVPPQTFGFDTGSHFNLSSLFGRQDAFTRLGIDHQETIAFLGAQIIVYGPRVQQIFLLSDCSA